MNEWRKMRRIGVIGGRSGDKETLETARRVGELIARSGAVLVCGGLGGVMAAAASGARLAGGRNRDPAPGPCRRRAGTSVFARDRSWASLCHGFRIMAI